MCIPPGLYCDGIRNQQANRLTCQLSQTRCNLIQPHVIKKLVHVHRRKDAHTLFFIIARCVIQHIGVGASQAALEGEIVVILFRSACFLPNFLRHHTAKLLAW